MILDRFEGWVSFFVRQDWTQPVEIDNSALFDLGQLLLALSGGDIVVIDRDRFGRIWDVAVSVKEMSEAAVLVAISDLEDGDLNYDWDRY